jgi:nitroreductase
MDIILNRRSVRKFDLSKDISNDDLLDLLKYGEAAPSARRQSSREYVIINDEKVIEKLSKVSPGAKVLSGTKVAIAVIGRNPNSLVTPGMQVQDLSASVQNILLAATQKGIGSCWIGIYPTEDRTKAAGEVLKVKDGKFVFAIIALGYPQDDNAFYEWNKLTDDMISYNEVK